MRRLPLLALIACLPVAAAAADKPVGAGDALAKSVPGEAQKHGLAIVEQPPPQDLDGDGKLDVAAACKNEEGDIVLALFKANPQGRAQHVLTSPTTSADELTRFQLRNMVGDRVPEMVLEVLEHAPDETRRQLHVYRVEGAAGREILSLAYAERPEALALDRVSFGHDEPGYDIQDLEGDGKQEVMIRREPRTVKTTGKGNTTLTLVTGVKETVYAWDPRSKGGNYVQKQDRSVNFLPAYKVTRVTASSQKLPEELTKAEQDRALEASFNMAMDGEGAAGSPLDDTPTPVEFNPAPRAYWVADNKLETGWVENAKGIGDGEWVAVELGERKDIRMVRVVPVCAADEQDMATHNEVAAFHLLLGSGVRVDVDRTEAEPSDGNVVAVLEVAHPEKKYVPQVLVFLQKGVQASSVRLVIDKVRRRGKGQDTCVSEMSVH